MIYSVSAVNQYIKTTLEGDRQLKSLSVRGEVSNLRIQQSGHIYFDLKDKQSSIKSVIWRSTAARLRYQLKNGMQLVAVGRIGVYDVAGQYQLILSSVTPDGAGDLALALEQLKEKLAAEGLFDAANKKKLPSHPKLIGVVTSPSGAVIRDIYNVSKRRDPFSRIILYPAQVQGEGSSKQIAEGIEFFNSRYPVDVLIVGRGGGSAEDLWCFNEEPVVRAIYASRIPVISAVGHETDTTLSDYAADVRASTPSQAAELAVPMISEELGYIRSLQKRLAIAAKAKISMKKQLVEGMLSRTVFKTPERLLERKHQQLDDLSEKLQIMTRLLLDKKRQHLLRTIDRLELMNPVHILKSGYGLLEDSNGQPVTSVDGVSDGEVIKIRLEDGILKAEVLNVEERFKDA
ncbi:MAG: exodeoxyribonuclease VII large subunit [Selenomonadaceae bacterium]|nr:exodeoxyribonuclease VII large subunit [Selenomonadaceae bacterium]